MIPCSAQGSREGAAAVAFEDGARDGASTVMAEAQQAGEGAGRMAKGGGVEGRRTSRSIVCTSLWLRMRRETWCSRCTRRRL